MNAVTDGIFNAPIAAVRTNRKISQNTTPPISAEGLASGLIFATYWPLCPECNASSSLAFCNNTVTSAFTARAIKNPIARMTRNPIRFGMNPNKPFKAFCRLWATATDATMHYLRKRSTG